MGEQQRTGPAPDADLIAREPIFDRPEFIWDEASFDAEIAPDFAEIGASGRWHSRADIKAEVLARLAGERPTSLVGGFRVTDTDVVPVAADLVHVRYTLHGQGRVTRRTTLYRRCGEGWQALFHQGTVVAGAQPLAPTEPEPPGGPSSRP